MTFKRYMAFHQQHNQGENLGGIADCYDSRDDKQTAITGARVLAEGGGYKWTYVFDRITGDIIWQSDIYHKKSPTDKIGHTMFDIVHNTK